MKIALDIGHASGTGARGNGLEEHAVAKEITRYLSGTLRLLGHTVTVIDYPEVGNLCDLNATIREANRGDFDFGISIHCDCSDNPNAKGAHVCYMSTGGKRLADAIAYRLCSLMPGRADKVVKRDNLAVLKQTKAVWVLCECGFISNEHDAAYMRDVPQSISQQIVLGIGDYIRDYA